MSIIDVHEILRIGLVILFILIFLATLLRFEWLINMKIIDNPNESATIILPS